MNTYKVNDKTFKPIPKPRTIQRPIPLPRRKLQGPPIPPPRPNTPRKGLKETFYYGNDSLSCDIYYGIITKKENCKFFTAWKSTYLYASQRKNCGNFYERKRLHQEW